MLPLVLQVFLKAALDEMIGCSLVGRFEKHTLEQKNSGLCNIVIEKTRKCQNLANSVVCLRGLSPWSVIAFIPRIVGEWGKGDADDGKCAAAWPVLGSVCCRPIDFQDRLSAC